MEGTNEKEQETKIKEIQNHETLSKYEPAGFLGQVSAMTNNKYMLSTFCLASQNTFLITVYNCYFFFNRSNCTGECTQVPMWRLKMLSLIMDLLLQKQQIKYHYFTTPPAGTQTTHREVWRNGSGWGFCSYVVTARVKNKKPPFA